MNEENQDLDLYFAETWNGRGNDGNLIGLGTELITGQSILRQIGMASFFFISSMFQ